MSASAFASVCVTNSLKFCARFDYIAVRGAGEEELHEEDSFTSNLGVLQLSQMGMCMAKSQ